MTRFTVTLTAHDLQGTGRLVFLEDGLGQLIDILHVQTAPEDSADRLVVKDQTVQNFAARYLSGCFTKDTQPVVVEWDDDGLFQGWHK